ncbi:MAG TPA: ComEC/Rec2 family competence protein [Candidatus Paceibacterota bacterium]|nr:ComEC/Rec2 family competence protein [Candidatus Paceibacterota bacterium]
MQRYGLYVVVLAFASGVVLRSLFTFELPVVVWVLLLAVVVLMLGGRQRTEHSYHIRCLALGLVCVALGMLRMEVATWSAVSAALEPQVGQTVEVTGVVVREPDVRERSQHLYLRVPDEPQLLLVLTDRYRDIAYGDQLRMAGQLSQPEAFTTELGRTFDYPGFLQAREVSYLVRYPEELSVVGVGQGNPLIAGLLTFKEQFQVALRSVVPAPSVQLAEGILLGEKQGLGETWEELFRRTGVIHIVVLSGFNVMLVVGFMLFTLSYVTGVRGKVIGGLIGITTFVLLVGLSPSVTRAGIMAGLVLLALLLGRSYAIVRALLLAGAIMVLVNPYVLLYDPGFQLSFMATLGLIVVAPYFEERLTLAPQTLNVRSYIVATIATQIAVLPLLLYHIGEVSLVAVLANVLVLPAVATAMALAFATGLVALIHTSLALPLAWLTDVVLRYMLAVVAWLGEWPLAAVPVPYFPIWALVLCYALVGYWWYRRTHPTDHLPPEPKTAAAETTVDVSGWTIDELVDSETGATRRVAPVSRSVFNP